MAKLICLSSYAYHQSKAKPPLPSLLSYQQHRYHHYFYSKFITVLLMPSQKLLFIDLSGNIHHCSCCTAKEIKSGVRLGSSQRHVKTQRAGKTESSIFFPCASPKTTHRGLQLYTVINIWPWSYTWKKFATTEINNLPLSKKNKYKDTHRKLESLHLFLHQNKCFSCKLNASGN